MTILRLTYNTYALELEASRSIQYPRTRLAPYGIQFSANGTPLRTGTAYEPKMLWTIAGMELDTTKLNTAERLYGSYMETPGSVRVEDYIQYVVETAPRTRSLATGGSEDSDGTTVKYFASFDAEIVQWSIAEAGPNSSVLLLSAQLIETDLVAA